MKCIENLFWILYYTSLPIIGFMLAKYGLAAVLAFGAGCIYVTFPYKVMEIFAAHR